LTTHDQGSSGVYTVPRGWSEPSESDEYGRIPIGADRQNCRKKHNFGIFR
jgi:hypothetical protein